MSPSIPWKCHKSPSRYNNWKMKVKNFSMLCVDWSALRASMPLPLSALTPYFKHLPLPLQPDHFKSHGRPCVKTTFVCNAAIHLIQPCSLLYGINLHAYSVAKFCLKDSSSVCCRVAEEIGTNHFRWDNNLAQPLCFLKTGWGPVDLNHIER